MLKKYLLSVLLLSGLVFFNFVPVFASLPSDKKQKHVRFSNKINIVKAENPSLTVEKFNQNNSGVEEIYNNTTKTTSSPKNRYQKYL